MWFVWSTPSTTWTTTTPSMSSFTLGTGNRCTMALELDDKVPGEYTISQPGDAWSVFAEMGWRSMPIDRLAVTVLELCMTTQTRHAQTRTTRETLLNSVSPLQIRRIFGLNCLCNEQSVGKEHRFAIFFQSSPSTLSQGRSLKLCGTHTVG